MTIIQLLMTLTRYFKPYKFSMVVILLILLSQMAFDAGVNVSFKFIIDEALIGKNLHLLVWILAILGFSVILITVLTIVGDYLYSRLFSQVLSNIRQKLFRNLQFLSLDFYAKNNTGDIIARFSTDLAAVENALVAAIPWGIYPSFDILGSKYLNISFMGFPAAKLLKIIALFLRNYRSSTYHITFYPGLASCPDRPARYSDEFNGSPYLCPQSNGGKLPPKER